MDTNKSKITGGVFMSIKKRTIPPRYDEAFKSDAIKMVTDLLKRDFTADKPNQKWVGVHIARLF